jgi:hypothetical protein
LAACSTVGATVLLSQPRWFDVYGLSAVALGLNTLVVAGLARALLDRYGVNEIGALLFIGLVAAGLLAASVSGVLHLARRQGQGAPT